MKMTQEEFEFEQKPPQAPESTENDPVSVMDFAVTKTAYEIESLETDTPDKLLKSIVRITRPRGADIGFTEVKPHLTEDALAKFVAYKDQAVASAYTKLDGLISRIHPGEPAPEIFRIIIEDCKKTLTQLVALEAREYLTDEQSASLKERIKALEERRIEFAPLTDDVEAE